MAAEADARGGAGAVAPRLRRAFLQMALSRWAALAIGIGSLLVLSRLLTPREFGLFAGLLAASALAEVLCDFGVAARIARADTLTRAERSGGEGLALALSIVGGALFALFALAAGTLVGPEGQRVLLLLAPSIALMGVVGPCEAALGRTLRFGLIARLGVVRAAAEAGVAVALAALGAGAPALAAGLLAARALQAAVLIVARARADDPYAPRLAGLAPFARFGRAYVPLEGLLRGGEAAVQGVIAAMLGGAALGLFDRARRVVGLLDETLLRGLTPLVLPGLSRALQAGEPVGRVILVKSEILIGLLWPAFALVTLLAEPLVLTVLGSQWEAAVPAVRALAVAGIALPVGKMATELFVALDAIPAYIRIRAVHQAARVALVAAGAAHSLTLACAGAAASTFLRAGMIELWLHRHTAHRFAALTRPARDGALLAVATISGPAALLALAPGAAVPLQALLGLALGGVGWLVAALALDHRLAREGRALLADLRRPAASSA